MSLAMAEVPYTGGTAAGLARVPLVVDKTTVSPAVVMFAPLKSLSWTVITVVEVPSRAIEFEAAVMNESAGDGATVKFTNSVSVMADPPTVPVIVVEAADADEVRVAV